MYMVRCVWNCARGKSAEFLEDIKAVNGMYVGMGNTSGRIYVDYAGRMDTVIWELDVESLDQYFTGQRGFYAELAPTSDPGKMVEHMNANTVLGTREIYQVVV